MSGGDLLLLGLGNVLCRDDGLGVAALARLARRYSAPAGVQLLDGGTLGLALLPHLRAARAVILIDAIAADAPAGSLVRVEGRAVAPAVEQRLSPHQVGVSDLLDGARLLDGDAQPLVLIGLVPERIELGMGLTAPLRARLDDLVDAVVEQARAFDVELTRRTDIDRGEGGDPLGDAARVLGL